MDAGLNDNAHKNNDDKRSADMRTFSILSYIGVLWIVGLISEKDDPTVRFHVNQGIIKTIVFASLWFVIFVISKIFAAISSVLIAVVALLWLIYFSIMFVYIILGIVNAKNQIQKPLRIIGSLFRIL